MMTNGEEFGDFMPGLDPGLKKWLIMRQTIRDVKESGKNDVLITCANRYRYQNFWKEIISQSQFIHENEQFTLQQFQALINVQSLVRFSVVALIALKHKSSVLMSFLLDASTEVTLNSPIDDHQNTMLHIACHLGDLDKVQLITSTFGVNVNAVNLRGDTPLHMVAGKACSQFQSIRIVQLLLQRGAECRVRNQKGHTPLHAVCIGGNEEVAELLLSLQSGQRAVRILDREDRLPLDLCCNKVSVML